MRTQSLILKNNSYIEFAKFALVGVANTAVDLGLYVFLTRQIGYFENHLLFAKALTFIAATICSFTLNRRWTFNKRDRVTAQEIIKFYSTVGTGIFINVGAVYFFHHILGINDIIAAILATGLTVFWGFAFSKFWVFKK